jgi:hypothetical protein
MQFEKNRPLPDESSQRDQTPKARSARPQVNAHAPISESVISALISAQEALAGESNDDEHDALLALVEALEDCNLVEWRCYDPGELIEDFYGWAGLDNGELPESQLIDDYVRKARPADSNPLTVKQLLCEWAENAIAEARRKKRT